jgi:small subunit ribosomal protein S3e
MSKTVTRINLKKKFIADGVFHAELHGFLSKALISAGYAGIEIRKTPAKTEIKIKAVNPQDVWGVEGRRLRELELLIQKRYGYSEEQLTLGIEKISQKGLCAASQAENLKMKLVSEIPVRMAAQSIIKSVMKEKGARGCEVIISGKLKQQRAKTMKFKQGYMICTGQPKIDYVDVAVRHVFFKQGIMGVKVKIMLPHDPTGKTGPRHPIPDTVIINDPPKYIEEPTPQGNRGGAQFNAPAPAAGEGASN